MSSIAAKMFVGESSDRADAAAVDRLERRTDLDIQIGTVE
jgi:hypothetical protein